MKPGDTVFYLPSSFRRGDNPNPIETRIKTVGRKYFTVDANYRAKFEIDTGLEETDSNYRSRIYLSMKEFTTERERERLLDGARTAINLARLGRLTNSQLEALIDLLTPTA